MNTLVLHQRIDVDPSSKAKQADLPDAAQTFQFALPNLCFQSLITPGGNSRLPTPVRRQASGHIGG
jgi:hypothetical protein